MGNYQYYLFDLDGTLTDSGEGIMNSIRHALHKFGITSMRKRHCVSLSDHRLQSAFRSILICHRRKHARESIITGNIILTGECLKMRSIMA